jgi:hypothetical protein
LTQIGKYKLVRVTWEDAFSNACWHTTKDIEESFADGPYLVDHVGWLLKDREDGIVLASRLSIPNGGTAGQLQFIPRGMIRKVKRIG